MPIMERHYYSWQSGSIDETHVASDQAGHVSTQMTLLWWLSNKSTETDQI